MTCRNTKGTLLAFEIDRSLSRLCLLRRKNRSFSALLTLVSSSSIISSISVALSKILFANPRFIFGSTNSLVLFNSSVMDEKSIVSCSAVVKNDSLLLIFGLVVPLSLSTFGPNKLSSCEESSQSDWMTPTYLLYSLLSSLEEEEEEEVEEEEDEEATTLSLLLLLLRLNKSSSSNGKKAVAVCCCSNVFLRKRW